MTFLVTAYRFLYLQMASLIGYGWAIVALSFICSFLMLPLMRAVAGVVRREKEYEDVIDPQIAAIKRTYASDMDRHFHIQRLYARYAYSPLAPIKKVLPLFVQIPFLLLTYYMLKGTAQLSGVSFLFLSNLGQPDGLIPGSLLPFLFVTGRGVTSAAGHAFNLLPLLMTAVNILTVFATPGFSSKDWKQAIGISFLFLILLYGAPSALLLYWTLNNIITFIRTILAERCSGGRLLASRIIAIGDIPRAVRKALNENVLWYAFFGAYCMAAYFFITAYSFSSMNEACHGLTFTLSIGGFFAILDFAAVILLAVCWKQKLYVRIASWLSCVPVVCFCSFLVAAFFVSKSTFWMALNNLDIYACAGALWLILLVPLFSRLEIWHSSWRGVSSCLMENAYLIVLIIVFAIHYAFSSSGFHLPLGSVVLLSCYMAMPFVVAFLVTMLLLRDKLDASTVFRMLLGLLTAVYFIPMISHDAGALAFDNNVFIRIVIVVLFVATFIKVTNRKFLLTFISILSVLVLANAFVHSREDVRQDASAVRGKTDDFLRDVTCAKSNNVYLLVFDGYANRVEREALKLDPSFDVDAYLRDKGFSVYNAYSVGEATVESMSGVFTVAGIAGETDRSTMAGDSVFCDFLKRAGYRTSFVLCGYAMPGGGVRKPGDFYYPMAQDKTSPELVLLPCIWRGYLSRTPNTFNAYTHDDWLKVKDRVISEFGKNRNFIYAHSGAPGHACREPSANGPVFRDAITREYGRWLENADREIRHDVESILARDANALVIVASDHGAHLMMPDENGKVDARHVLDRLGVLLAVRWPDGYEPAKPLNCLQNVLLEAMICLSGNESLRRYEVAGESHEMKWPVSLPRGWVREGLLQMGSDKGMPLIEAAELSFGNQK